MPSTVEIDLEKIYGAWRTYLLANSKAKHFGMLFDPTKQAKFPYANLRLISRPKNRGNLGNDELSISLTFEAEAYINNDELLTLYNIDTASANFFVELGFSRIGDSAILKVSNTVTKITSRFYLAHYTGYFLNETEY